MRRAFRVRVPCALSAASHLLSAYLRTESRQGHFTDVDISSTGFRWRQCVPPQRKGLPVEIAGRWREADGDTVADVTVSVQPWYRVARALFATATMLVGGAIVIESTAAATFLQGMLLFGIAGFILQVNSQQVDEATESIRDTLHRAWDMNGSADVPDRGRRCETNTPDERALLTNRVRTVFLDPFEELQKELEATHPTWRFSIDTARISVSLECTDTKPRTFDSIELRVEVNFSTSGATVFMRVGWLPTAEHETGPKQEEAVTDDLPATDEVLHRLRVETLPQMAEVLRRCLRDPEADGHVPEEAGSLDD